LLTHRQTDKNRQKHNLLGKGKNTRACQPTVQLLNVSRSNHI